MATRSATDPVLVHVANARAAAARYGVRVEDILGILSVEAGTDKSGNPVAPGDHAGPPSFGQFTYGTGRALGIKYGDSASETNGIARYLVQLGYKSNRERAIAAYNGGPGNPQFTYAAKVDAAARRYIGVGEGVGAADPLTPAPAGSSSGVDVDGIAGWLFGPLLKQVPEALLYIALVVGGAAMAYVGIKRTAGARQAIA